MLHQKDDNTNTQTQTIEEAATINSESSIPLTSSPSLSNASSSSLVLPFSLPLPTRKDVAWNRKDLSSVGSKSRGRVYHCFVGLSHTRRTSIPLANGSSTPIDCSDPWRDLSTRLAAHVMPAPAGILLGVQIIGRAHTVPPLRLGPSDCA